MRSTLFHRFVEPSNVLAQPQLVRFKQRVESPPRIHNITYRGVVIEGRMHNDDPTAAMAAMGFGNERVSGTLRLSDMELDLIQGSFDPALRDAVLPDRNLKARKLAGDTLVFVVDIGSLSRSFFS